MEVTTTYRIRPHHGMCLYFFEGKVDRYDAGVLKYTGLKAGQEMTFAEFERIVEEKILQPGYGKVICGDCQWRDICHK